VIARLANSPKNGRTIEAAVNRLFLTWRASQASQAHCRS
jgi:hypothetical protein